MECKYGFLTLAGGIIIELIETLWNVNKDDEPVGLVVRHELIETLWNVNNLFKDFISAEYSN